MIIKEILSILKFFERSDYIIETTNKYQINMSIKNVKFKNFSYGIRSSQEPNRQEGVLVVAKITYNEKEKKTKEVTLDDEMVKKGYFKGWIIGLTYFVGITENSYQIYNEDGERIGTAQINEVGKFIQANENDFICLQGKTISLVGIDGKIKGHRELTEEEYNNVVGNP